MHIKIGLGGDCGVYCAQDSGDGVDWKFLFRIFINTPNIKRDWKKIGHEKIPLELADYGNYSRMEIGSDIYFRVSMDSFEKKIQIDRGEFEKLEPFAIYSTKHIVDRVYLLLGISENQL
ncbi:MAG: hypothetical protein P4L69_11045 [Desulfosporosinus sp.]|nr:hypothetical protein [Desulfosporosinus sp.]